ncbi:hypothetical protein ACFQ3S_09915 [Mucilaginibacter terrae]|uniref:DUF3108 domain-containing protein n=1 Tax=Mucilaginibacter terrae TaxID=1955052 RepID=UPI0036305B0F
MFKKLQKTALLFMVLGAGVVSSALAQTPVDTLTPGSGKLLSSALKPGIRQYLVYTQQTAKSKMLGLSYWVRDVKAGQRNGEKVIMITQHWYGTDTLNYRTTYSVNRAAGFAPIYHTETLHGDTRAFNWGPTQITGADTVAANALKTFKLDFKVPAFNWNLDIETFEQLPLAAGKAFAISFYDAGVSQPNFVLYKVNGSEILTLFDNTKTDCWILLTEGKAPNGTAYTQSFWISKKGHEFIKEEDRYGGNTRVKIKLAGAAPNVVAAYKIN